MINNSPTKIVKQAQYVPRKLEKIFEKYLSLPQIIAIIGPRRSGKTFFLKHLENRLPHCQYLSFENQKILDLFDLDIASFADLYLAPNENLILDEFQYAKNGGKNLKYLYDAFPGKKIFISGSSAIDLTIKALKYLVGRVLVFKLFPFDFEEFLSFRNPRLFSLLTKPLKKSSPLIKEYQKYLEEYLLFGGYPEVVLQKDTEVKKTLLENIYSLYFLKEVKDLISLNDDYKLKNLIKGLSLQIGNLISYQELSRLSGFEFRTLKKSLNFLEKTFVTFLLPPYFVNKRSELSKNPKVYFYDTGLRNSVLNNFSPLDGRTDKGGLIENFVAVSLKTKKEEIKFWRSKAGAEVDFVSEADGRLYAFEVKSRFSPQISLSLRNFIQKFHPSEVTILTDNYGKTQKIDKTRIGFLPVWNFKASS